jgi:ubiquinone/menaquinone biosynthesis C-methylase UbiE
MAPRLPAMWRVAAISGIARMGRAGVIMATNEADRIRAEYDRRDRMLPPDFYALTRPANLFADQQKTRWLLQLLTREGLLPLTGKKVLDIGCGDGQQLLQFESWGAKPEDLAGIELMQSRIDRAAARFAAPAHGAGPQLRLGDASALPWPSATFDLAHQGTVFTSVLDGAMKRSIANDIIRVLKPGGVLIWYDFFVNNPANPSVKGISAGEVRSLFPGCVVRLKRITLAPPIARRLVPMTWLGSLLLERLAVLNTHYLGVIRKRL